jgi:phosphoserine aminotransferase
MKRAMNFGPGPAALPLSVLKEAQAELLDFAGTGMSVLECSHRSPEYDKVHNETSALLRELLGVGENFKVIFLGGGASLQFAMVPLNFLYDERTADYLVTGTWAKNAFKEAKAIGKANAAASTDVDGKFTRVPKPAECKFTPGASYLHFTSNNTIFGTQYATFPESGAPLVADMSSDFLWRPFDASKLSLIYAGAQKNLGPAGVTVVMIREDFLAGVKPSGLPTMLSYKTHVEKNSLHNTPPCFAIYLVGKVLAWIKAGGGLPAMEKRNREKAGLIYGAIDRHAGFYKAPVEKESRSTMNIVFRLPSEELEKSFIAEGKKAGMIGLKGHRSVGGIRVSCYNAVELDWVKAVAQFMEEFVKKNG